MNRTVLGSYSVVVNSCRSTRYLIDGINNHLSWLSGTTDGSVLLLCKSLRAVGFTCE